MGNILLELFGQAAANDGGENLCSCFFENLYYQHFTQDNVVVFELTSYYFFYIQTRAAISSSKVTMTSSVTI